jgi:hypothetical protein
MIAKEAPSLKKITWPRYVMPLSQWRTAGQPRIGLGSVNRTVPEANEEERPARDHQRREEYKKD